MYCMSSAMAGQFVAAAIEMSELIATLGLNPLRKSLAEEQEVDHVTRPTEEIP